MNASALFLLGAGAVGVAIYLMTQPKAAAETTAADLGSSTPVPAPVGVPRSDWPGDSGDPIWQCCYAIATAEGYGPPQNNPTRLNNPGDISDGASQFGSEFHSGSNVTHFPDAATGWQWLHDKVQNIVNGMSHVYQPDMSWVEIAQKWAGDWQNWVRNVTHYLGVDPDSRFGDYFGV